MLTERELRQIIISDHSATDVEAWERFEAEYSPKQTSSSPVKREIENAKYGLDTIVFAIDHCATTVESYVDFSFAEGGIRSTRTMSSENSQDNPRVKLDLNIEEENKPCYAGVRVIIPFGN
jgi:hypothetical protein